MRTRAATPHCEAISIRVPTNPIVLANFGASVDMQDPSISGENERAKNETVIVFCFAATGKRGALLLQMALALPVLAIDHAWTKGGLAAEATPREAVEQAKAPFTFPIRADRDVLRILVAACLHRSSALRLAADILLIFRHGDEGDSVINV